MSEINLNIIYEDGELLVLEKPPAIPSQKDKTNDTDMLGLIYDYLGNAVFPVHRLDRPVGGVMVFAKTKKAASHISSQIQNKTFSKKYLAVVCGISEPDVTLTNYMVKNGRLNISKITHKNTPNAKEAVLLYKTVETVYENGEAFSLLKITPLTGRHHQIRVQLSYVSLPIWGDTKYNEYFKRRYDSRFFETALYSHEIQLTHPKTQLPLCFNSNPPDKYPFSMFIKLT